MEVALYTNLKKYQFHKNEIRFLGFVVLANKIKIEEEKIETVRDWIEPKLVRDMQMFLGYINFYGWFIKNFNKIGVLFISILQITSDNDLNIQAD